MIRCTVNQSLFFVLLVSVLNVGMTGTPCPAMTNGNCYCSMTMNDETVVTCATLRNSAELAAATEFTKSMIVDRMMLLGNFHTSDNSETNEVDSVDDGERLPPRWLASTRVRELEIQNTKLSNCFLCNGSLDHQEDFLVSLVVTHSCLEGYLCSTCSGKPITTRYLQKLKNVKLVDFSFNSIEIVAGNAFPGTMEKLSKIVLSNNKISKVYDKAFSNLNALKELDLSRNVLTSVIRTMFRPVDITLQSLDLSWNSIQSLPEDLFLNMKSLKEIKLSNNLIEVLSENTFTRMSVLMEKIDIKGNFLVCNCSLSWIGKKLSRNTKISGKCVTPKEVEFQEVKATLTTLQPCK